MNVAVLTANTNVYQEQEEDESGQVIKDLLEDEGETVVYQKALPTDQEVLATILKTVADNKMADLILTTGGSGCAPSDCMPEATMEVSDRLVPGIMEAVRAYMAPMTKRAMFNRGTAGIRGNVLIINLPGKAGAVREALNFLMPELEHIVATIQGEN